MSAKHKSMMKNRFPGIHVDSDLDSSGNEKGKSKDNTDKGKSKDDTDSGKSDPDDDGEGKSKDDTDEGKDDVIGEGKSKDDTDSGQDNVIVLHKSKDDTDSDQDKKGDEKDKSNLWTQETVDRLFKEAETPGPDWPKDKNYLSYLDKSNVIVKNMDDEDYNIVRKFNKEDIEAAHGDKFDMPMSDDEWKEFKKQFESSNRVKKMLHQVEQDILEGIVDVKGSDDDDKVKSKSKSKSKLYIISTQTPSTTEEQLNKMTEDQLNRMTKDQLHLLLLSHDKRVNNRSKIRKGELIDLIVEGNFNWRPAVDKSEGKDKKGKSKSTDIVSD